MNDLLISVRALGRADYSKQCLDSLLANSDLDCDFFLFQDGAVNPISGERYAKDKEVKDNVNVFIKSKLPNKTVMAATNNIGGANAKVAILNYAFPKYKYLMMLDNDLIFNKYYIKTVKTLFKQFDESKYVGMIQTSYRHFPDTPIETKKFAKENENKVAQGFSHRWEQGFFRSKWDKIGALLKDFAIINKRNDTMLLVKNDPRVKSDHDKLCATYGKPTDDYILETCTKRAGLTGIHTLTLRHIPIGEKGQYTMNENRWRNEKFSKIKMFDVGNVNSYKLE